MIDEAEIREMPEAASNHNLAQLPAPQARPAEPSISARALVTELDLTVENLLRVRRLLAEAVKRAHRDSDGAIASGATDISVSGSRIQDRATAEKAIANIDNPDRVRDQATRLADSLYAASSWSSVANSAVKQLVALDPKKARLLVDDGPKTCANRFCGEDVWGTPADRLRAGRCTPCYMYRLRNDEERPERLCHPEEWAKKQGHDARVTSHTDSSTS